LGVANKVKSLQDELQKANRALASETSQNAILNARLSARSQSSTAQISQELLSDLSGLIFRNVERSQGNTTFDCLQCGRNGSIAFIIETNVALHYKLTMEDKDVNDPHGQIVYTPLLDPDRDEKIMNVLPDYLTDEIMFAREQGPSFPVRLM
jgi:3-deoxy-D-manno-octulosonic-acid transferase